MDPPRGDYGFMAILIFLIVLILYKPQETSTVVHNKSPNVCNNPVDIRECTTRMYLSMVLDYPYEEFMSMTSNINKLKWILALAFQVSVQQVLIYDTAMNAPYAQIKIQLLLPPSQVETVKNKLDSIFTIAPTNPVTFIHPNLIELCRKHTSTGLISGIDQVNGTCTSNITDNSVLPDDNIELPMLEKAGYKADPNSDLMMIMNSSNFPVHQVWWLIYSV
jgi:hypothetical protein